MNQRSVTAEQFESKLPDVLNDVEDFGLQITVTKHGRPVARLIPIEPRTNLIGSVDFLVPEAELLAPIQLGCSGRLLQSATRERGSRS